MPKRLSVMVKLPEEQPDRCLDCPLLGVIPIEKRKHGSKKTHVCLGTYPAIKALAKRLTAIRKSDESRSKPLQRPCDKLWHAWIKLPKRQFPLNINAYNEFRQPYLDAQQYTIDFDD